MSPRQWYIGVAIIALAILLHAAIPRYEWRMMGEQTIRVDRWTGEALHRANGGWAPLIPRE